MIIKDNLFYGKVSDSIDNYSVVLGTAIRDQILDEIIPKSLTVPLLLKHT